VVELYFGDERKGVETDVAVSVSSRVSFPDEDIVQSVFEDFTHSFDGKRFRNESQVSSATKRAFKWVAWANKSGWESSNGAKFSSISSRIASDHELVSADEMENYCASCAKAIRAGEMTMTRGELRDAIKAFEE